MRDSFINWRAYYELCKPRVVVLMILTALVGMHLATSGAVPFPLMCFAMLGIALAASSAATINHVIDQQIDAKMGRTQNRPIPTGQVSSFQAFRFAAILGVLSMAILIHWVNVLTAVLTLTTLIGYAVVYTVFLKHATPQNIVIGGAAGAAPPLLGWTAVTGTLDPQSLLLVLIIFVWTPPHFWALAIHRLEEYKKAGVPMLPVTHGVPFTKLCIVLYTFLLVAASLMPFVIGMSGSLYFYTALILGFIFVYYAAQLYKSPGDQYAFKTFRYSIWYLLLLFTGLLLDHYF